MASIIANISRSVREYLAFYLGLFFLAIISLLWSTIALPLNLILPDKWKSKIGRLGIRMGFRIYLRSLSIMKACYFDLSALDSLCKDSPMIIAPNHPSLLDALMVISRIPDLACVMKSKLVNNLFFGAGARLAKYIRNDSVRGMIYQAIEELHSGNHLLFFPEGTRSNRHPVGKMYSSIALIAREAQVPIQTVFIQTDSSFLGKSWPFFRKPNMPIHFRIRLGKRFDPPNDARIFTADLEDYFMSYFENKSSSPFPQQKSNVDA